MTTSEALFLLTWEWISTISLEGGRQDQLDDRLISLLFARARFIAAQWRDFARRGCQMIAMFDNLATDGLFLRAVLSRSVEVIIVLARSRLVLATATKGSVLSAKRGHKTNCSGSMSKERRPLQSTVREINGAEDCQTHRADSLDFSSASSLFCGRGKR